MTVSGILVRVTPARYDAVRASLSALPGVDVHEGDAATGRLVVTQEADSVGSESAGLKRIQAVPHVLAADLVYHRFDDDPALAAPTKERAP